jgi:PleD family two-component response regulator
MEGVGELGAQNRCLGKYPETRSRTAELLHMRNIIPKKILIVDDDVMTIATMAQTLLRNGYQILHATDMERAFKKTKKDKPDLIICNSESKKLDVQQLLKSIRTVQSSKSIPLLLITESPHPPTKEPSILGPQQRLNRPFTREQLTIAVQENLKTLPQNRTLPPNKALSPKKTFVASKTVPLNKRFPTKKR